MLVVKNSIQCDHSYHAAYDDSYSIQDLRRWLDLGRFVKILDIFLPNSDDGKSYLESERCLDLGKFCENTELLLFSKTIKIAYIIQTTKKIWSYAFL